MTSETTYSSVTQIWSVFLLCQIQLPFWTILASKLLFLKATLLLQHSDITSFSFLGLGRMICPMVMAEQTVLVFTKQEQREQFHKSGKGMLPCQPWDWLCSRFTLAGDKHSCLEIQDNHTQKRNKIHSKTNSTSYISVFGLAVPRLDSCTVVICSDVIHTEYPVLDRGLLISVFTSKSFVQKQCNCLSLFDSGDSVIPRTPVAVSSLP